MWLLRSIWLCLPLSLALSDQHEPKGPGGLGVLHCGWQSFQFTVDLGDRQAVAPALTAWDKQGLPHRLRNDSDCGTWVKEGPGSSVVLEVNFNSCYVTEGESHHVMPIGVEGTDAAGRTMPMKRRLLRCPAHLPALDAPDTDLCDSVPVRDRLPCTPSPVSRGACEALGCCSASEEEEVALCYYGNTVTSRCTQEGYFYIAVSLNVVSPPLRLDSVYFVLGNDSDCNPRIVNRAFLLFWFPFTSCGTTRRTVGDHVVYENELVATRDVRTWDHGSITRDSILRLRVSCSYSANSNTCPVNVWVFTLPPPVPEAQPGPLTLELQIARDENYSSYYTAGEYPVVKLLRDPIYVEVSILHRTDPNLGLLLHQCWATPSPNPLRQPQWPILVKGCPYAGDNYQTRLIPVQKSVSPPLATHRQRFSISTFSFVDSEGTKEALGGQVYLHCSVSVCQPAGTPACVVTCPVTSRRRKSDFYFQNTTASISSNGSMLLLQASRDSLEQSRAQLDPKALWVAGFSGTLIFGALLASYLAIRKRR